jgi:peptide/nickel transport system permease protein
VPVSELVLDRIWVSLPLAIYALTLSTLIAFPVGILAAANRGGSRLRRHGRHAAGHRDPEFLVRHAAGPALRGHAAMVLGRRLPGWEDPGAAIKALTLPAIALALPQASILARVMRSALLETLGQDYIRTARAKGLSRRQAVLRHALKNALIPVLTIIGLQFSFLLAGAIIIENVFFLPGLGRLIFQGITQRDLVVVESVTMLLVFAVIVVTFLVDIAYALVDPRLRRR